MTDRLLALSANPNARRVIQTLGLPVPLPPVLERDGRPWQERPLEDRTVTVGFGPGAQLVGTLAACLAPAGAAPRVVGGDLAPFIEAGEAWGRPPVQVDPAATEDETRNYALIFDATGLSTPEDLRSLHTFFHPRVRGLSRSGRVIVLARPVEEASTVAQAAARRALEGFTRSLAKELGRNGGTANQLTVMPGAEDRLAAALRWFASPRSAYVSGQHLIVSSEVAAGPTPLARPLDGKVAMITGAARGIGAATAEALAREGAHVIVLDRPADDALASEIARKIGGSVLLHDVTSPEAPAAIAAYVRENFGRLDILVHNAGITRDKTLGKMKQDWWDLTLDVNLGALLRITDALDPLLPEGARIVALSSIAGIAGNPGQTNYGASKAGVIGLISAYAEKYASRGIAVNGIAPGFIETRLTDAIPVATREVGRRLCNLSQGGLPGDVAEAITFLSSPGAQAFSGQILRVCGGNLLGR
jgi:3-oxoacyl-[acyl-carrier protein] reductase